MPGRAQEAVELEVLEVAVAVAAVELVPHQAHLVEHVGPNVEWHSCARFASHFVGLAAGVEQLDLDPLRRGPVVAAAGPHPGRFQGSRLAVAPDVSPAQLLPLETLAVAGGEMESKVGAEGGARPGQRRGRPVVLGPHRGPAAFTREVAVDLDPLAVEYELTAGAHRLGEAAAAGLSCCRHQRLLDELEPQPAAPRGIAQLDQLQGLDDPNPDPARIDDVVEVTPRHRHEGVVVDVVGEGRVLGLATDQDHAAADQPEDRVEPVVDCAVEVTLGDVEAEKRDLRRGGIVGGDGRVQQLVGGIDSHHGDAVHERFCIGHAASVGPSPTQGKSGPGSSLPSTLSETSRPL